MIPCRTVSNVMRFRRPWAVRHVFPMFGHQIDCGGHQTGVYVRPISTWIRTRQSLSKDDLVTNHGMLGSATYVCDWPDTVALTVPMQCASSHHHLIGNHQDSRPLGVTLDTTPGGGLSAVVRVRKCVCGEPHTLAGRRRRWRALPVVRILKSSTPRRRAFHCHP